MQIPVTEEIIAQVTGLPTNGARWFSRKHVILNAQQDFLQPGENAEQKGRGVALRSLPQPWPKVAEFVKHYLTCEGRYQVIYQHDFVLLNHLRHGQLINMPYYLLGCLKNMSRYTVNAKHPLHSLKHHRLAQLLINRGLAENNPPPLINPQPAQRIPPPVSPQQKEEIPQPEQQIPPPESLQQEEAITQSEQQIPIPHQEDESSYQDQETTQDEPETPHQQEEEIPRPVENIPQQAEGIPDQTEEISEQIPQGDSEQIEQTPPLVAEDIQGIPEIPMQTASPPAKSTPSTPILSISTDESEDNIPINRLKRKQQSNKDPPKRKRTRSAGKAAATSVPAPILEKPSRKRKVPQFSAFLPKRRTQSSIAVKSPSPAFPVSPPITLKTRTPLSPEHSPPSPSEAEMQGVHDFVTSFFQAAVTQEPAADTQDSIGQMSAQQETATTSLGATKELPAEDDNEQRKKDPQHPSPHPADTDSQPTIAALQEEIEFLKRQVQEYQEEAERVREAYQSEYNLHILAKVASAEEKTKSEFMCSECTELFTTVGYKVVEVPLTGVIPESSIIEEKGEEQTDKPAVT